MYLPSLLLLESLLFMSVFGTTCKCGKQSLGKTRILGGGPSKVGSHPWYATILYKFKIHCGGTIINSEYVLTAAHCITLSHGQPDLNNMIILMNYYIINDKNNTPTLRFAKEVKIHPGYNKASFNDLALIHLIVPIEIDGMMLAPACLPQPYMDIFNKEATIIGFGNDGKRGYPSRILETKIMIKSDHYCKQFYKHQIMVPNQLCATNHGKDSCQGDSGGPLLLKDSNGTINVVGITSRGLSCTAAQRGPGVYVNLMLHLDWVQENSKTDTC